MVYNDNKKNSNKNNNNDNNNNNNYTQRLQIHELNICSILFKYEKKATTNVCEIRKICASQMKKKENEGKKRKLDKKRERQ